MTGQLADVSARLGTVRQLDTVVGAMRGMAAARAQQSRNLLPAIRTYADVVAGALAQALRLLPAGLPDRTQPSGHGALVVFCAEQGFAGAFSEAVLDTLTGEPAATEIFLIGARGVSRAEERGLHPVWTAGMVPHVDGLAGLAQRLGEALYTGIRERHLARIALVLPNWTQREGLHVEHRALLPLDPRRFARPLSGYPPLINLAPAALIEGLAEEYVHAQLREAVTIAFAAENEARMSTMAAARSNIERMLGELGAKERQLRQDGITAEVIELAGGRRAMLSG
ncbi:F-type H+-transporting ATPase subunit gamma [Humitalea rosea]|uniref:F-type H+-transporting ATPase subunit gamma n=1 Tax=Humitalea rosea TaxID=990373 RepID=A0A2W7HXG3_9PROT|nr:F0F1 ATP synthase subunit gamma [Humitalea rosea]PZW39341.1 F-type H+-transporting ATPase subunit gamma [Humitalea rosea]